MFQMSGPSAMGGTGAAPVGNGRAAGCKLPRAGVLARVASAGTESLVLIAILFVAATPIDLHAASASDLEFFEKNIRPVLVERCYECHGAEKQKGGLRLDSRDAILKGGDSGPALVSGKPAESLLFNAITWEDPDFQMPPKNKLPDKQIAHFRDWIQRGAPDPREPPGGTSSASPGQLTTEAQRHREEEHWAYQPITRATPPKVNNTTWPRSEIDRFILAKIEQANLTPARDADRTVLLRRVYFDLAGLPPTPDEIDAFLADTSSRAYEKLVDRLLNSPHFGERWGRHWLDIARYAESVTLRGLVFKEAWRYRNYVIEAFNRDLPFDQFIREQIAGDLLDCDDIESQQRARIATTYLVLGNHNYEEQDKEQLRMDIVDEQLDTIGKGLLAQTIGCARCHDHKFDPIPTRDYYALAGILRNTKSVEHANVSAWLDLPLPVAPELEQQLDAKEKRIAELNQQIKEKSGELARANPASKKSSTSPESLPGIVIDDSQAERVGAWVNSQYNKPYIAAGYIHDDNQGKGSKTVTFHPGLKSAGRYEVRLAYTPGGNRASNVPVTILHAAGETTVHVSQKKPPALDGHFVSLGQFNFEKGNQGYVLVATADTDGHVVVDAVQFLPLDATLAPEAPPKIAASENNELVAQLKTDLEKLRDELKRVTDSAPKRPLVMSVSELPKIENAHVHIRGSVHNLGPEVPRGFLKVAHRGSAPEMPSDESGRRQLADWIASPQNPLTARVFVNRAWLWLFGEGLVRTPDNFGATGNKPSHPELLDFLAARFIENGWSVKQLVRELVLTRAYQLASDDHPALLESDPENRLFARANRRPLDAESLRDSILAASGQLVLDHPGPTIKPGTAADFGYFDAGRDALPRVRSSHRSIYVPAFRNTQPEIFQLFDFADTSVVTGERPSTIGAPQALYFLNNPFILEHARLTAERVLASTASESPTTRANYTWRLLLGRNPTPNELRIAEQHLARASTLDLSGAEAWTEIIHSLLASLDFRTLH